MSERLTDEELHMLDQWAHRGELGHAERDDFVHRAIAEIRASRASTPPGGLSESDLLEQAWVVIANASGGNWSLQSEEWRVAASQWRTAWEAHLLASPPASRPALVAPADRKAALDELTRMSQEMHPEGYGDPAAVAPRGLSEWSKPRCWKPRCWNHPDAGLLAGGSTFGWCNACGLRVDFATPELREAWGSAADAIATFLADASTKAAPVAPPAAPLRGPLTVARPAMDPDGWVYGAHIDQEYGGIDGDVYESREAAIAAALEDGYAPGTFQTARKEWEWYEPSNPYSADYALNDTWDDLGEAGNESVTDAIAQHEARLDEMLLDTWNRFVAECGIAIPIYWFRDVETHVSIPASKTGAP